MLAKRIIPCLDVANGKVIKGIKFQQHQVVGDILECAEAYNQMGADELVFYDITASSDERCVETEWIKAVASKLNIPFCVAGGIKSVKQAEQILNAGADKISINSPALENPNLINDLVKALGTQCVVIGIDSLEQNEAYRVCQYTGTPEKMQQTSRLTQEWIGEVQDRGAGEIVLNCMNQDGVRQGYDIKQLKAMRQITQVPLIASGGAGALQHFLEVFQDCQVEGALAASVFHYQLISIPDLKQFLSNQGIKVRR